jgi:hypothetical protein
LLVSSGLVTDPDPDPDTFAAAAERIAVFPVEDASHVHVYEIVVPIPPGAPQQ